MRFILLCAGVAAGVSLCACAITPETAAEESAWLAIHAVDTAQTLNIAHTPDVDERESNWAMGHEPSTRSVALYMGAMAALHIGAALYMDEHDWPRWSRRLFEGLTIADASNCVIGNYRLGIAAHF